MAWQLIEQPTELATLARQVAGARSLAIDTEAASFHRYHDRIYLIQLSTPELTAVIDPLAVGDLASIGAIMADPTVTKIFHDGDYDLRLFDKTLGIHAHNLFDTRIAAQFLGEPGIGLAALLEKYFDVHPDKRFQRADWSARPLSSGMLEYAAGDTSHLHALRDLLEEQLAQRGRLDWALEEFERLEQVHWDNSADSSEAWLKMKGARALDRRALALLRELHHWREGVGAELDRALFRVMGNDVLLELAQHPVRRAADLAGVRGINRDLAERRGVEIMAAIARGLALPEEELPRFPRARRYLPDPDYERRLEALKVRRNRLAEELELPAGVLCPNGTLEAIAREQPTNSAALGRIPEVRRWQVEVIGDQLLQTLSEAG